MKGLSNSSVLADEALMCTISGEQGVGKTSFAAEWPKPVILDIEGGLRSIADKKVPAFQCPTVKFVEEAMKQLYTGKHEFETMIVDSMTALEAITVQEMLKKENSKSLAHLGGGYGAGYRMLETRVEKYFEAFNAIRTKCKMHIVLISQSEIETFTPEDSEPFDRLTVRIDKRCKRFLLDKPDLVGFIRQQKTVQKTSGSHIAKGTEQRELLCHKSPSATSKNRIGINNVLELAPGTNPILNAEQRKFAAAEDGSDL